MPTIDAPILSRMLRPLAGGLRDELLQAVAELQSDPAEEARFHELAERNAEGVIAPEERRELEAIVSANTLLSVLRAEARAALRRRAA
jgi:hypothetical protein